MATPIYKKDFHSNGYAEVSGEVMAVYDSNADGTLVPAGFRQEDSETIFLRHAPHGQTYIQYKT